MSHCAPLVDVPRESAVSTCVLRALFETIEMAGVSREELLRAANIELSPQLGLDGKDARVSRAVSYRLCELAMDLTGNPAFGLHWAVSLSGQDFSPVSQLIAHAPTLRQAFESLSQFHRLLTDQTGYELIESEDTVVVQCARLTGESPRTQRFVAEMLVSGIFKMIRSFGVHTRPPQVNFEYSAPPYRAEYTRVFRGAERFDQPFTGIVFERALMNAASPHKDADVHSALRSIAERRMLRLTQRTPYSERVRELLVQRGSAGQMDMKTVANLLDLSVRSLRRRLSTEGRTYKSVANEARAILAKHLLRSRQATIQEVAYELGFGDTSAFHRAFKRRTGMTPQAYRAKQLTAETPE